MKTINLEAELSLNGMTFEIFPELKNKEVEIGDLIQKKKHNLGVILKISKDELYLGNFDKESNIMITEFNQGTFAQFHSTPKSKEYFNYKSLIDKAYLEATQ